MKWRVLGFVVGLVIIVLGCWKFYQAMNGMH